MFDLCLTMHPQKSRELAGMFERMAIDDDAGGRRNGGRRAAALDGL